MGGAPDTTTHGSDGERELAHGVEGRRAGVDEVLNELGDRSTGGPVGGESGALLLGRDLSGEEEPEEGLGERLLSSGRLRKELLALGDGLSTVKERRKPGERRISFGELEENGARALKGGDPRRRLGTNRKRIPSSVHREASGESARPTKVRRRLERARLTGVKDRSFGTARKTGWGASVRGPPDKRQMRKT